jgi:hypothetical protein
METANDLRFSPFDRGQWGTSIYVRNQELTSGQCWSVSDGHFEIAVVVLVSDEF